MKGIDFAQEIISKAFVDKTDLVGEPYLNHIWRVYESLRDKNESIKIVALLHDLLEDCPEWNEEILRYFFQSTVVDAVVAITKIKGEKYSEYINRVYENRYATIVKIADLKDNMDVSRLRKIEDKDIARLKKYVTAFQHLSN